MIKSKLKKILTRKEKGQGDLIASLFVILALVFFVYFFINTIADVNTRIQMDQIARKYILYMESAGYLSNDNADSMKAELASIPSVHAAMSDGAVIDLTGTTMSEQGYGKTIVLQISCPAYCTNYVGTPPDGSERPTTFGGLSRNRMVNYQITKQSTAKY